MDMKWIHLFVDMLRVIGWQINSKHGISKAMYSDIHDETKLARWSEIAKQTCHRGLTGSNMWINHHTHIFVGCNYSSILLLFYCPKNNTKTLIHRSWVHWQTWKRHWGIAVQGYNVTEQSNKTRHSTIAMRQNFISDDFSLDFFRQLTMQI